MLSGKQPLNFNYVGQSYIPAVLLKKKTKFQTNINELKCLLSFCVLGTCIYSFFCFKRLSKIIVLLFSFFPHVFIIDLPVKLYYCLALKYTYLQHTKTYFNYSVFLLLLYNFSHNNFKAYGFACIRHFIYA